jgi:hypothetical protein
MTLASVPKGDGSGVRRHARPGKGSGWIGWRRRERRIVRANLSEASGWTGAVAEDGLRVDLGEWDGLTAGAHRRAPDP